MTNDVTRIEDHILRGSILPLVSGTILGEMAKGEPLGALRVTVDDHAGWAAGTTG